MACLGFLAKPLQVRTLLKSPGPLPTSLPPWLPLGMANRAEAKGKMTWYPKRRLLVVSHGKSTLSVPVCEPREWTIESGWFA